MKIYSFTQISLQSQKEGLHVEVPLFIIVKRSFYLLTNIIFLRIVQIKALIISIKNNMESNVTVTPYVIIK